MSYPIVYDRFETEFDSFGLAVLENAKNVKVREVDNGEYILTLILPRNDLKWTHIKSENYIKVDGQRFRIKTFDEQRTNEGKLLSNIQCQHAWYDASDSKHIPLFEMIGKSPRAIMEAAFAGTRFTVGTVDAELANTDIILSKTNPAAIVTALIKNVGGELERDNYIVGLRKAVGNNNGVQFRTGKNNVEIKKTTSTDELCTRLYPYGKDDLDITSVNGGVAYIESPYIGAYDFPHENFKDFNYLDDPAELMAEGQALFSTAELDGIDKPKITYEVTVVELKKLMGRRFESFSIGDTVRVIDEDMNIDVNARIVEYDRYPYDAQRSSVVLANYKDDMTSLLVGLVDARNRLTSMTTPAGKVKVTWFENIIESLQTEIEDGLQKKAIVHDHGDIWVDDIENPTKAMTIVNGMFAIADNKKANGDWDWRTFGTGSGFVADQIISGIMRLSDSLSIENANGTLKVTSTGIQIIQEGVAQFMAMAGQMAMMSWNADDGIWEAGLYYDTNLKQYVFNGRLTALAIEAIGSVIAQYITAEHIDVAHITVDRLSTSEKVQKYLNGDTTDVKYRIIDDEQDKRIVGSTDGTQEEQHVNRYGQPLYWEDESKKAYTTEVTDYPVMVFVYDELIKKYEYFEHDDVNDTYYPVEVDGAGNGDGDNGKCFRWKDTDGYHIKYVTSTGDEVSITLKDDGTITTVPPLSGGTGGGTKITYLNAIPTDLTDYDDGELIAIVYE